MNALDIVIGLILVYALIRGIFRGLVEEISSIVGVFAGIYGAVFYYPRGAAFLSRWVAESAYANIISFLVIFGLIFIVIGVLGILIKYILNIASLGWLDRLCGVAFGGIKGVLISAVLLFALTAFLPRGAALIKQSHLAPHVNVIAERLAKILPQDIRQKFVVKIKELKSAWQNQR
ncbi:MAG: CvpA family protein [Desulfosarcina sp.]|nr:CvpA family protein [Desulfobacterales bacterium]